MRLFLAVTLDPAVKQGLCAVRDQLAQAASAGRFTPQDNFHITLAFLGDIPPSRLPAIRKSMDCVHRPPFSLTLNQLGCFRRQGGDIWWMGMDVSPELTALAEQLSDALRAHGFSLEDRPFSPHITLGRQVRLPREFHRFSTPTLRQRISAFALMQSERRGGRPVYTSIFEKTLK